MMHDVGVRPRPSGDAALSGDVLAARFEQQVAGAPDKTAILTDRGEVTYRELDAMADGIAAMLRSASVDPKRPIALLLQDMILCVAAMLGAAKAGRVYIPLDIGFPEAWLAQTLETAEAALVFTDADTAPIVKRVASEQTRILELDQASLRRETASRPMDGVTRDAGAPAFILFTSGSTGQPKGVIHSHEFLVHQAETWSGGVPIGPQDRVSLVYSCAFAAGIISTFVAILGGGTLYPFDLRARGLSEFSTWLADKRISVISMTSSLFRTWLAAVPKDIRYPALRLVRNVSEPVYSDDIARAALHLSDAALVSQSLAMSEAGTVAVHTASPSVPRDPGVQPVGRPVHNMEIRLESEDGAILGPGEVGEIVLRSRYLSLGYWKDPESTAAKFHVDPVDPALRLYHTGDLGRWRSDGDLEYFGRRDRKVKVRGYTVELYEIERALLRIAAGSAPLGLCRGDRRDRIARPKAFSRSPRQGAARLYGAGPCRRAGQDAAHLARQGRPQRFSAAPAARVARRELSRSIG